MKKGFFFWLGHLTALILAAGMVISLPFAIAARDLGAVLFSRERVRSIMNSRLLESGLLDRILLDTLFGGEPTPGQEEGYRRAIKHLSGPERQELLTLLLPSGWTEEQITAWTHAAYDWLESEQPYPELVLDLRPIKAQLLGESLDQAVEIIVDSWPSCSPDEVDRLQRVVESGGEIPPFVCEPPEPLRSSIVDMSTRELANETQAIPDQVMLLEGASLDHTELQSTKRSLRSLEVVLGWSWLVPLAALGPIMAFKVRDLRDLGRWWGVPLFFSGVAAILLFVVFWASRGEMFADLLLELGAPDSIQYEVAAVLLQGAVSQALRLMVIHALLITIVGLVGWFILTRRRGGVELHIDRGGSFSNDTEAPGDESQFMGGSPPPLPPLESSELDDSEDGPPSGIFG